MSTATSCELSPATFEYIRSLVLERSAIALESSKGYLVEARLTPLVRKHGLGSLDQLVARLKQSRYSALHDETVDAMTTNETSFFRDLHPFETLRESILPELIQRRATGRRLAIWSAACSTGQEPYTLAILLREHFPQLATWEVTIWATDLAQHVLDRAASGRYSQAEVNRGLPAPLLVKYFERHDQQWAVKEPVRQLVRFTRLNLIEPWGRLPTFDLVFMRNVLIYFQGDTKRQILAGVRRQLAPDGTLFLGGAETTLGVDDAFERVSLGKTMVYRPGNSRRG